MSTKRLPAAQRKKQILKSAIRVFARSTYHGATTKGISEEAGVTEALIYRYFGSKRQLFTEAIKHTASRLIVGIEEILDEGQDHPVETITACVNFYVHILETHQELAKMIFLVLAELDEEDIREAYLPYQKRALTLLTSSIERWQNDGIVGPDLDPEATAWLFFGTYMILALVKQSMGAVAMDSSYAVGLVKPFLTPEGLSRIESHSRG
ncbi:MAG: TetR/AcrR family transcriptional regulator [Bradymonadaceae bacterium]